MSFHVCTFWQEMAWATFWAIFSQTHLVTLFSLLGGHRETTGRRLFVDIQTYRPSKCRQEYQNVDIFT
jgi:hypothetical protein